MVRGPEQRIEKQGMVDKTPFNSLRSKMLVNANYNNDMFAVMSLTSGGGYNIVRAGIDQIIPGTDIGSLRTSKLWYGKTLEDGTLALDKEVIFQDPLGVQDKLKKKEENKAVSPLEEVLPLGCEDPDLYIDSKGRTYLFFTMAFSHREPGESPTFNTYLGVAQKESPSSNSYMEIGKKAEDVWIMKNPVLISEGDCNPKEATILPNGKALYEELVTDPKTGLQYSQVRIASYNPEDITKPWKREEVIIDPYESGMPEWIQGFASTGPVIADLGGGQILCWVNGRGKNTTDINGKKHFSPFKIGMAVIDANKKSLEWISDTAFIEDRYAKDVTFVSDGDTNENTVCVRGHVDDEFITEYTIDKEEVFSHVPAKFFAKKYLEMRKQLGK